MRNEKRTHDRERCYSKVWFKKEKIVGYIRDISKDGFKIDLMGKLIIEIGSKTQILVIPVEELKMKPFDSEIEVRWKKEGDPFHTAGMRIINENKKRIGENYEKIYNYYRKPSK